GDGLGQVAVEVAGEEVGDDLGVGVAAEGDALGLELALEGGVVLDDAVVHQGDGAVAGGVGGGVAGGGGGGGGPAGVAGAGAAGGGVLAEVGGQVGDAAGLLADVQLRAGVGGHAGAVVAAVLQPPQPLHQDRLRLTVPDVTHDATHGEPPARTTNVR